MVHYITNQNFVQEAIRSYRPVLLDFWAPWCAPCRMLGTVLDEIAKERSDIKVCKVNVDEEMELASRYRVASIPTMLVMEGGEIQDKLIGYRSKEQILELFV